MAEASFGATQFQTAVDGVAKVLSLKPDDVETVLHFLGFDEYKEEFSNQKFLLGGGQCSQGLVLFTFILLLFLMVGLYLLASSFVDLQAIDRSVSDYFYDTAYPGTVNRLQYASVTESSLGRGDINYWAFRNAMTSLVGAVSEFFGLLFGSLVEQPFVQLLLFGFVAELMQVSMRSAFGIATRTSSNAGSFIKAMLLKLWKMSEVLCEYLIRRGQATPQTASEVIQAIAITSTPTQSPEQYAVLRTNANVQSLMSLLVQRGIVDPLAQYAIEQRTPEATRRLASSFSEYPALWSLLISRGIARTDVIPTLVLLGAEARRSDEDRLVGELLVIARQEAEAAVAATARGRSPSRAGPRGRAASGAPSNAGRQRASSRNPRAAGSGLGGGESTVYERTAVKFVLITMFRFVVLAFCLLFGLTGRFRPVEQSVDNLPESLLSENRVIPALVAFQGLRESEDVSSQLVAVRKISKEMQTQFYEGMMTVPLFRDGLALVQQAHLPQEFAVAENVSRRVFDSVFGATVNTVSSLWSTSAEQLTLDELRQAYGTEFDQLNATRRAMELCKTYDPECERAARDVLLATNVELPASPEVSVDVTAAPSPPSLVDSQKQNAIDILARYNIVGSEVNVTRAVEVFTNATNDFDVAVADAKILAEEFERSGKRIARVAKSSGDPFPALTAIKQAAKRLEDFSIFFEVDGIRVDFDNIFSGETYDKFRYQVGVDAQTVLLAFDAFVDQSQRVREAVGPSSAVDFPRENTSGLEASLQTMQQRRLADRLSAALTLAENVTKTNLRSVVDKLQNLTKNVIPDEEDFKTVVYSLNAAQQAREGRITASLTVLGIGSVPLRQLFATFIQGLTAVIVTGVPLVYFGVSKVVLCPCRTCCRFGLRCCKRGGGCAGGVFNVAKVSIKATLYALKFFLSNSVHAVQFMGDAFDDVADEIVTRTRPRNLRTLSFVLYDSVLTVAAASTLFASDTQTFAAFMKMALED